ncbi:MAG: epoxyqueuosine reductase QueH [Chloroflexi bacterium]|nr:epoxyqueuosine reductase QueH [Chloroflexota bacterium]
MTARNDPRYGSPEQIRAAHRRAVERAQDDAAQRARSAAQLAARLSQPRGEPLLVHICCGPCALYPLYYLAERGWDITGFWYNPNIAPAGEYRERQASAALLAELVPLRVVEPDDEGIFARAIQGQERFGERCAICYQLRLERTAQEAAQLGLGVFSTSLLISPYQDIERIRAAGTAAAARHGVQFYDENLRRGYAQRGPLARVWGMYLQNYCGCAWSAREAAERRGAVKTNADE